MSSEQCASAVWHVCLGRLVRFEIRFVGVLDARLDILWRRFFADLSVKVFQAAVASRSRTMRWVPMKAAVKIEATESMAPAPKASAKASGDFTPP